MSVSTPVVSLVSVCLLILSVVFSNVVFFNSVEANELSPPKLFERVSPVFLDKPLKSNYLLPDIVVKTENIDNANTFTIKKVQIKGNSVLSKSLLSPLISSVMNRPNSLVELEQLRYNISKLYYDLGFINSGVILPKQKYENGLVVFIAIEGVLSDVKISGLSSKKAEILRRNIIYRSGKPFNIKKLQAYLNQQNASSQIKKMSATFLTGSVPGKSILDLKISKYRDYKLVSGLDNYRSPSVGAERAFVAFQHDDITGNADLLLIQAGLTKGINDYSVRYDKAFDRLFSYVGTSLSAYFLKSDSQLIEDGLISQLDIRNSISISGITMRFNLPKNKLLITSINFGFEILNNDNSIIGTDTENVLVVSNRQLLNAGGMPHTVNTTLRLGRSSAESIDGFVDDAASFSLIKIKTHSVMRIPKRKIKLAIKTYAQISSDSLRWLERISMGGFHTVRGYRENTLVRDNGVVINIEATTPLRDSLTATVFTDLASGWNNTRAAEKQLMSVGAGINWVKKKSLNASLFLGLPMMNKINKNGNLQDLGLHFSAQYQY